MTTRSPLRVTGSLAARKGYFVRVIPSIENHFHASFFRCEVGRVPMFAANIENLKFMLRVSVIESQYWQRISEYGRNVRRANDYASGCRMKYRDGRS